MDRRYLDQASEHLWDIEAKDSNHPVLEVVSAIRESGNKIEVKHLDWLEQHSSSHNCKYVRGMRAIAPYWEPDTAEGILSWSLLSMLRMYGHALDDHAVPPKVKVCQRCSKNYFAMPRTRRGDICHLCYSKQKTGEQ